MLEIIRDDVGGIKAVCEYVTVNDEGLSQMDGKHMFILEMEIAPQYRGNGMVRTIIKNILHRCPSAQRCGWVREYKYKGRPIRSYTREQFEKLVKEA